MLISEEIIKQVVADSVVQSEYMQKIAKKEPGYIIQNLISFSAAYIEMVSLFTLKKLRLSTMTPYLMRGRTQSTTKIWRKKRNQSLHRLTPMFLKQTDHPFKELFLSHSKFISSHHPLLRPIGKRNLVMKDQTLGAGDSEEVPLPLIIIRASTTAGRVLSFRQLKRRGNWCSQQWKRMIYKGKSFKIRLNRKWGSDWVEKRDFRQWWPSMKKRIRLSTRSWP